MLEGERREVRADQAFVSQVLRSLFFPRDCISWAYERGGYGACSVFLLDYVFSMNPFLGGEGGRKGWLAGVCNLFLLVFSFLFSIRKGVKGGVEGAFLLISLWLAFLKLLGKRV